MILRRITEHVKAQNWTAVVLDFVIVVVGVFIGIQVSNWNDARGFAERERILIQELREEVVHNAAMAHAVGEGLTVGEDAARRILARIEQKELTCTDDCWPIIADLMHASQWQRILVIWTTYDELRREGLPRDRRIIEAVETYKNMSHRAAVALETPPHYRALVRSLMPIAWQDAYWEACFVQSGGMEEYRHPCAPPPGELYIDPEQVAQILAHPDIATTLREWTSIARVVGNTQTSAQQEAASQILAAIDRREGMVP